MFACVAAAFAAADGLATAAAFGTDTAADGAGEETTGFGAVTVGAALTADEAVSAVSEILTDTADDGPVVAAAACEVEARLGAEAAGAATLPRVTLGPEGVLLPERGRVPRWPDCTDARVVPASADVLDPVEPAEPLVSA